jgi:Bacterial Ig domain
MKILEFIDMRKLFIILTFFICFKVKSQVVTRQSGDSNDPATYACGVLPTASDNLIIGSGDMLTYSVVSNPNTGTFTLNSNGSYQYYNGFVYGLDSLVYKVCDNGSPQKCKNCKVKIFVFDPNAIISTAKPIVMNENVFVRKQESIEINLRANDLDISGNTLNVPTITTISTKGAATISGTGILTYTSNSGQVGLDSLVYQVCNNAIPSKCSNGKVKITIVNNGFGVILPNYEPNLSEDVISLQIGTTVNGDFKVNDTDPNAGNLLRVVTDLFCRKLDYENGSKIGTLFINNLSFLHVGQ